MRNTVVLRHRLFYLHYINRIITRTYNVRENSNQREKRGRISVVGRNKEPVIICSRISANRSLSFPRLLQYTKPSIINHLFVWYLYDAVRWCCVLVISIITDNADGRYKLPNGDTNYCMWDQVHNVIN